MSKIVPISEARARLTQLVREVREAGEPIIITQRSPSLYLDKQIELLTYLSQIMGTDRLDVVILNRASPLLAHRILADGRLLFSKDERQRICFQTRAIDLYLDTEPARRESDRQLIQRIKEGQFGYR